MIDIALNTAIKVDETWYKIHVNETRQFYVDIDGQATSGDSLPALVDALKKRYKDVHAAFQNDSDDVPDQACIFHPGNHAPESMKDYRIGASIAQPSPPSVLANARRSICDSCVFKILRSEEGLWSHYEFDPETRDVRQKNE